MGQCRPAPADGVPLEGKSHLKGTLKHKGNLPSKRKYLLKKPTHLILKNKDQKKRQCINFVKARIIIMDGKTLGSKDLKITDIH